MGLFQKTRNLFGQSIVNSNGEEWQYVVSQMVSLFVFTTYRSPLVNRKFRTSLNPPFRYDVVKNWVDDFRESSLELMKIWETQMENPVDVLCWMPRFTLDVLGKTTFSQDFNAMKGTKDEYFPMFTVLVTMFTKRKLILAAMVELLFISC
jgi:cytochrome P450